MNLNFRRYLPYALVIAGLLGLWYWSLSWGTPSDTNLQKRFSHNQVAFNSLVQMSNQDWHVVTVTSGFTWLDTDFAWPRKDIGFPQQRWDEYKRLFRELGLGVLSRRGDYPDSVFLIVSGSGVLGGIDKGYAYSPHPLSPILQSLESSLPKNLFDSHGHAIAFKPLTKNWYIYREEDW